MKNTWTGIEVKAAGAVVAGLGVTVLVGWATQTQSLVMIYPPTAMQRNTALGLLVCGLGMIWLAGRRKLPVLLSGAFCVVLGLLTAVEYAFRLNLGIDELLGRSYSVGIVSPPGRMSPITTLCFMLAGFALLVLGSNLGRRFRSWAAGIAGPVLAAIGGVAGMGYVFGNTDAYGWSHLTRIAFDTALAFLLIGISLAVFAWSEEGEADPRAEAAGRRRLPEWLPLSLGIAVLTATLGIWQALMAKRMDKRPFLPEIALVSGVVVALLLALLLQRMQGGNRSPESTLLTGFGLALAMLLAVGVIQYRNLHALVETDSWVAHNQTVLTELGETVSSVQRMESDVRGYVATGDESFVKKSGVWATIAFEHMQALRNLTADNPQQQHSLDRFEPLLQQKVDFMRRLALLRREQGQAAANSLIAGGEGIRLMDQIRALDEKMKAEENALLLARKAESTADARKANVVVVFGTLLALTFVLGAAWTTRRDSLQRRQAEFGLRESQALTTSIVNSTSDYIWSVDAESFGLLTFNRGLEDYFLGQGVHLRNGMRPEDVFTDQGRAERWRGLYRRALSEGRYALDYESPTAADLHLTFNLLRRDDKIFGISVFGRDISERKRAEAEIRKLNEGLEERVRERTADLEAANTAVHAARSEAVKLMEEAVAARATTEETNRKLLREIAERQQAETALRQSEEQNRLLADLLERSDQPFGVAYPDGRLGPVNAAFERLTGYGREELSAMDWGAVLTPPEWRELERTKLEELHRTGQPVRYEKEYLRKDGSRVPMELLVHLRKNDAGQPAFYYSFLTDLTERRRSENALRESEAQFRTLANAIPQLSWMARADGWLYWYNERWYEYTGTTPAQMEGWGWQSVHDPEALPKVMERWKESIATGKPFDMVFPLLGADGVFRPFLTRVMPVHDHEGKVSGWFGTNTDISEQRRTEQELERLVRERTAELARSVALLKTVTSNAPVILVATDAHGVFTVHTGKAIPIIGHQAGEVIGENYQDVPFFFPESRDNIRRALDGEEFTVILKGGAGTVFEARYAPLRDSEGKIAGMIGLSVDVTERVGAEQALRESQKRLDLALEAGQMGAWDLDLVQNTAVRTLRHDQIFGYDTMQPAWSGEIFLRHVVSEDRERVRRGFEEANISGRLNFECEILRADGARCWIAASGNVHRNPQGAAVRMLGVVADITERKYAEERLRESEEQYRTLFNSIDEGFCTIEVLFDENDKPVDYRFLDTNPSFEKQSGLSNARGRRIREFAPQHEAHWFEIFGRITATGEPARFEHEAAQFQRWFDVYAFRIGEPQQKHVACLFSDISERKRAEEAIRQSEAALKDAQRVAHLGNWHMVAETGPVTWSEELFRMLGLDPTLPPPPYEDHHRLFTPESWGRLSAGLEKATRTGAPYELELEIVRADGSRGWMLARGEALRGPDGAVTCLQGIALDITERKRAEAALQESKEAFRQANAYNRSLIEASLDPLVTISADGRVTDVNRATERVTGFSRQELIGTDFTAYFTEADKARAGYEQVFREGWVQDYALEIRRRDGIVTPVVYNASVYRDEAGRIVGVFASARDITERKRAEEEVRRLNESLEERVRERTAELEAANQELQAFTYSVSHDLRAPLRHIAGFSKLLEEEHRQALPEEARHYIDVIRGGTRRMGQMVDDLLSLSRVGRQDLRVQMAGLNSLIEEVRKDLQPEIAARTIEWKIGPLPFLECDPGLVKQVLANLLSNAVKFTRLRPDAVIEVGSTVQHRSPVIFVRDNGVGFSMKYSDKLFGVFQRLHRAEDFEGTGVGLATVQRIVNKHGGRVWAEAKLNEGATFYFTLGPQGPEVDPAAAEANTGPASSATESHSPLRGAS